VPNSRWSRHYQYPPQKCDVTSFAALDQYRAKRDEWLQLLRGDPEQSVRLQISGMMWADAAFRTLTEAQKFGTVENPTAATAPLVTGLLMQGYVATMVLTISKLTDPGTSNPKKGVISLRRVAEDMRKHRTLITREMFVCHDGLPFDTDAAERDYLCRHPPVDGGLTWLPSSGPEAYDVAARVHLEFDRLTEAGKSARSREDLISEVVFDRIVALLDGPEIKLCRDMRNKFVAHAADAVSRQTISQQAYGITLGQIARAQRALVSAQHRVLTDVLGDGSGSTVPTPQFNHLRNLDRVFVPQDKMHELRDWWRAHKAGRDDWTRA
jgi:hypothetical protein